MPLCVCTDSTRSWSCHLLIRIPVLWARGATLLNSCNLNYPLKVPLSMHSHTGDEGLPHGTPFSPYQSKWKNSQPLARAGASRCRVGPQTLVNVAPPCTCKRQKGGAGPAEPCSDSNPWTSNPGTRDGEDSRHRPVQSVVHAGRCPQCGRPLLPWVSRQLQKERRSPSGRGPSQIPQLSKSMSAFWFHIWAGRRFPIPEKFPKSWGDVKGMQIGLGEESSKQEWSAHSLALGRGTPPSFSLSKPYTQGGAQRGLRTHDPKIKT